MKRIFIVGIARSGTTLLQSIVGNHPAICTFPETHFFSNTLPKQKLLRIVSKVTDQHQDLVKSFFEEHQLTGYIPYAGSSRNINAWSKYLIKLLDQLATHEGKDTWLEKTPMHLHFIDLIEKNTENSFFIHTIREPKANIAALYDVSKKHPGAFKQATLDKAINRYIQETSISQTHIEKKNHIAIHYEDIINQPLKVVDAIFSFLGMEYDQNVLNFQDNVSKIVGAEESWKANNSNELKLKDKVNERLTPEEVEVIENAIDYTTAPLLSRYD
jgi:hypothetical protein